MSLSIDVYYLDEAGKRQTAELESHMMGFESCRKEFWGIPLMRELGLQILPSLYNKALVIVEGENLDILAKEARIIQQNSEKILKEIRYDKSFLISRTNNVINAVATAKKCSGWVSII